MSTVYNLVKPCLYSFKDLLQAAGKSTDTKVLYAMSQTLRNEEVKKLCQDAGWFWKDVNCQGTVFTAFSPNISSEDITMN
jgi:hypothetical protein